MYSRTRMTSILSDAHAKNSGMSLQVLFTWAEHLVDLQLANKP